MVKKAIYWIDDSTTGILNIVHSVFPRFWDKRNGAIETHIRIIGNETQEATDLKLWSEKDEQKLKQYIYKVFEQFCRNEDNFGQKDLFEKNFDLIENNIQIMYKLEDKDSDEYGKLYSIWKSNEEITEGAKVSAQALLDKMNIAAGACVGLDLALLKGDIEKVSTKKQPILSMQLYNELQKNHKCFLYSKYVGQDPFIEGWKVVYENTFKDSKQIIIKRRRDLFKKNISEAGFEELKKLVEDSYKEEVNRNAGNVE